MIRVLLVDDHPPLLMGLRVLLAREPDITVVGEAETGGAALALFEELAPDVLVLDCELPDMDGVAVAQEVQRRGHATRVLALSAHDDAVYVRGMVEAGAAGYLLKNETPERLVAAVRAVGRESWFSPAAAVHLVAMLRGEEADAPTARERDVLEGLAQGKSNAQIGAMLHLSERTVAYHVGNLLDKLGAENRTAAVVLAIQRGWIKL